MLQFYLLLAPNLFPRNFIGNYLESTNLQNKVLPIKCSFYLSLVALLALMFFNLNALSHKEVPLFVLLHEFGFCLKSFKRV